jgi:hypothetical protein
VARCTIIKESFIGQFDDECRQRADANTPRRSFRAVYEVEAAISRATLEGLVLSLSLAAVGELDYFAPILHRVVQTDDPFWITWVDANGPEPDFHIQTSFEALSWGNALERVLFKHAALLTFARPSAKGYVVTTSSW